MTAWQEFSAADFDARQADKRALRQARQAAESGQAGLFFVATAERETTPKPAAEQLPGQSGLFGEDSLCPCKDCRPDACPPETAPVPAWRRHIECCGQAKQAPWCPQLRSDQR